jgi:hypothetical protein
VSARSMLSPLTTEPAAGHLAAHDVKFVLITAPARSSPFALPPTYRSVAMSQLPPAVRHEHQAQLPTSRRTVNSRSTSPEALIALAMLALGGYCPPLPPERPSDFPRIGRESLKCPRAERGALLGNLSTIGSGTNSRIVRSGYGSANPSLWDRA